ncbi:MAG: hypothetical protein HZA35_03310 [Parcubacteria group bacterium]|nr:hypothetical protein [Parcubacteria group bacterium]
MFSYKKIIVWLFLGTSLLEVCALFLVQKSPFGDVFFANVGSIVTMSGTVLPNPENTLLKQLRAKETQLTMQEEQLLKREHATLQIFLYGFVAWSVLLGLICINFYLDYRHRKEQRMA